MNYDKTRRLWSLWEIMNLFKLEQLAAIIAQIESMIGLCEFPIAHGRAADPACGQLTLQIAQTIPQARGLFMVIGLKDSVKQLDLAGHYLSANPPPNNTEAKAELRRITDTLVTELKERRFLFVEPGLTEYVDNPAPFGQKVFDVFDGARPDITAAANCMVAACSTAAVFHLMRSVEWGLRGLCANLGLKSLKEQKKSGKIKLTPVSHSQWEKILDGLNKRVDKKLKILRPGGAKQRHQEFYYPALEEISAIRDAWRNHVMHGRKEYQPDDAAVICGHVKRLMMKLAENLSKQERY